MKAISETLCCRNRAQVVRHELAPGVLSASVTRPQPGELTGVPVTRPLGAAVEQRLAVLRRRLTDRFGMGCQPRRVVGEAVKIDFDLPEPVVHVRLRHPIGPARPSRRRRLSARHPSPSALAPGRPMPCSSSAPPIRQRTRSPVTSSSIRGMRAALPPRVLLATPNRSLNVRQPARFRQLGERWVIVLTP